MFYYLGVMQYYQAQLADFIQYPDLRTEVFQCFREMGNALLFTMLIEQSLVCSNVSHTQSSDYSQLGLKYIVLGTHFAYLSCLFRPV